MMPKIYLVGGAVRDRLLNLPVTERDWVIVGATPDLLLSQGYQQVGKDFPVFLHPKTKEEYALARTERKSGKGYTGFICDFDKNITLEQDLIRRDLTINAIAMDDQGEFIDPYHGLDDIHQKVLRHISLAFREDPLRVLRVARFAARYHHLGFQIAPETLSLMQEITHSGEIACLTAERIWKETEKALSTQSPQVYFERLADCSALAILFPKLVLTKHVVAGLQRSASLTDELDIRFALLCIEMENAQWIESLCDKIKVPNSYRRVAIMVNKYHQSIYNIEQLSPADIINIFNQIDVWRNPHYLTQLIVACHAYYNQPVSTQDNYLYRAYQCARSVDVKAIINQGITGKNIQIELQKRRIEALSH